MSKPLFQLVKKNYLLILPNSRMTWVHSLTILWISLGRNSNVDFRFPNFSCSAQALSTPLCHGIQPSCISPIYVTNTFVTGGLGAYCRLMFVSPPKFICQKLIPSVLRGGHFGRWLRSWGQNPHKWDSCSYKRHIRESPCSLCHGSTQRHQSLSREAGSHQTPNLLMPWSWTSQLLQL